MSGHCTILDKNVNGKGREERRGEHRLFWGCVFFSGNIVVTGNEKGNPRIQIYSNLNLEPMSLLSKNFELELAELNLSYLDEEGNVSVLPALPSDSKFNFLPSFWIFLPLFIFLFWSPSLLLLLHLFLQACFKQTDTSCQIPNVITSLKAFLHLKAPHLSSRLLLRDQVFEPPLQRIQQLQLILLDLKEDWLGETSIRPNIQVHTPRTFTARTISLGNLSRGLNWFLNRSYF